MDELKQRIEALEVGHTFRATQTEVAKVEADMLIRLRNIRTALVANGGSGGAAVAEGGAAATSSQEVVTLRSENAELRKKTAKLQYRVEHLVKQVEQMYRQLHEEGSSLPKRDEKDDSDEGDDSRAEV